MDTNYDQLLSQGLKLEEELSFEEASVRYSQAAESAADNVELVETSMRLAHCHTVLGRWSAAEQQLQKVLDLNTGKADQVRALLLRGELLDMRGLPEFSGECRRQACQLAAELSPELRALAAVRLAEHLGHVGNLAEAGQHLEQTGGLLNDIEDDTHRRRIEAELYVQRGLCYFRLSKLREAYNHTQRAVDLLEAPADALQRAKALRYLGVVTSLRRQHRTALLLHLDAKQIFRRARCPFGQAKVYESLGRTFMALNRLEEAVFSFRRCESLCLELGAQAELATLYGKLGQVYMLREDYESSVLYFRKDLALSSQFRNPYALAYCYRNLGQCLVQTQSLDEAVESLQASAALFGQVGDSFNEARVQMDLCQAHLLKGQTSEAALLVARAREAFQERRMDKELAFLQSLGGTVARMEGRYEDAAAQLNESILQLAKFGDSAWLAEAYFRRGMLAKDRGLRKHAVADLKNAVRVARRAGLSRETGNYLEELKNLDERELYLTWMEGIRDAKKVGDFLPDRFSRK